MGISSHTSTRLLFVPVSNWNRVFIQHLRYAKLFLLSLYFTKLFVFCFFFLLICLYKTTEHLVHPTYASPVVTGDAGVQNVGPFSSNLDQLLAGKLPPTVSPTNPAQDSAENDGYVKDCSDGNQLIEVHFFFFTLIKEKLSIPVFPLILFAVV